MESLGGVSLRFGWAEWNPSGTGLVGPEEAGVMGGGHGEGIGWGLKGVGLVPRIGQGWWEGEASLVGADLKRLNWPHGR